MPGHATFWNEKTIHIAPPQTCYLGENFLLLLHVCSQNLFYTLSGKYVKDHVVFVQRAVIIGAVSGSRERRALLIGNLATLVQVPS